MLLRNTGKKSSESGWILAIGGHPVSPKKGQICLFPTAEEALQWAEDNVPHLRPHLAFLQGYETELYAPPSMSVSAKETAEIKK